MADFSSLKQTIQTYIKQNGNEEITGNILQDVLLAMVTTMGDSAINALASALQDEITARQNQDATLQGNINAEATARQQADTALGGRIDGLQTVINGINTKLAEGYIYAGIATPSTNPGTISGKVFYVAVSSGTYTNFSNLIVAQGINILKYNGSAWSIDVVYAVDVRPKKASQNFVISGGVFDNIGALDVSELNATENPHTLAQYADLSAALAAIPTDYQKGGMSVKFVHSFDNKYVQARCMAQNFTTDVTQWQGVDNEPTSGSDNLSMSGGIYNAISKKTDYQGEELQIARTIENAKLLDDPNNLFTTNPTTNVLFFKVGANKGYVVSGTCSIDACQMSLCSGIGATTFAPWQSVKNGSGSYKVYGKTNQTQQYIAITVDKNSTYSIKPTRAVLDVLTEEIDRAKSKDNSLSEDVRNIYNDLFKNKVSLQSARILTDMKINANLSSTTLLSASTTTDVIIFQVGANVLFNVIANSDIVDSAIALTAGTSSSDFETNKKILVDSNYNYFGRTTQEMQYVAITVKKETSYYCYKKVSVEREIINISTTDTEVQILTKMLAAYNLGECDVVFEHGVYTFDDVYLYMRDTLGWTWTMELPIGNNCRYYFNGSTLVSNAPSETFIDSRNILGCKAGDSGKMNYELYDGILINNGGTYCVHDECARNSNPYSHKYINMRMEYNMGDATESLSKCIGGGCGTKGFIIISDCIFINNNTSGSEDVSYHGLTGSETPISMNFFVSNSWFNHSFGVRSDLKATDDIVVKYSNCSQGRNDTTDTTYCNLYKFNIETRS